MFLRGCFDRMAIEAISTLKYTVETDYWSYGVLLWEMFTVLCKEQNQKAQPYEGFDGAKVSVQIIT